MSSPCCVRGCESKETHEHWMRTGQGVFGKKLTYIARICEPCRKALVGKPIQCNYFQCGGLAFVYELWEEVSGETI